MPLPLLGFLGSNLGNIAGIAGGLGGLFGGSSGGSVSSASNLSAEQSKGLREISEQGRRGLLGLPNMNIPGIGGGPAGVMGINPQQQQGAQMLEQLNLPGALGIAGQGQQTLGRMLDPSQNMEFIMDALGPIVNRVATSFSALEGARSGGTDTGMPNAIGRGIGTSLIPQIFQQQGQALANVPQFAGLGMGLQGQAAQGMLAGGGLRRGIGNEVLMDQMRQFERAQPQNNPFINMLLQSGGIPTQENFVSQSLSPAGAFASLATNQGVQGFLNNLGGSLFGGTSNDPSVASRLNTQSFGQFPTPFGF